MKRELRGILIGCLITIMVMGVVAYANPTAIEVLFNSINIVVDGYKVDVDNILYEGTTYAPMRAVAEMLGKDVGWDADTNTASIGNNQFEEVTVSKHVDGDTVYVTFTDGREEKVRFIGVDTPETVHPTKDVEAYGKEASDFTEKSLFGKTVYLEKDISDRDRYDRLLRYIWLTKPDNITEDEINNNMFNAILLKEGYAQLSTYPPDVKYVDHFTKIQTESREQNKGLWANEDNNITDDTEIQTEKTEGKYLGSKESDKIHNPTCRWAKEILEENKIWFDTIEEAKNTGYEPCGVCKPK